MMKKFLTTALLCAFILTGCANNSTSVSSDVSTSSSQTSDSSTESSSSAEENEYVPGSRDDNGVYVVDGYAAKLEYPLNEKNINYAAKRFSYIYEQYLKGNCDNVYVTVVPDKNYFLAKENGYPSLDHDELANMLTKQMDYAKYLNIYPMLELSDYYRTDTHWRQEKIVDIAQFIAGEMGVTLSADYTQTVLENPFVGIHCRQSEISIEPDELIYLTNQILQDCKVLDGETDSYIDVYNMELAAGKDAYEIFLSGAKSLLTIENPNATTDRELLIFRDSFASSIAPLFAEGYSKITLIDIRYLAPQLLKNFVTFNGQDVLFLYSTPVLNNSVTFK